MERNAHQEGGILEHPCDIHAVAKAITVFIVAPVVHEQWIVRVLAEASLRVPWRYGAGFTAVTGQAGSTVAAERLAVEEPLALQEVAEELARQLPGLALRDGGCCLRRLGPRRGARLPANLPPASWLWRRRCCRAPSASPGPARRATHRQSRSSSGRCGMVFLLLITPRAAAAG